MPEKLSTPSQPENINNLPQDEVDRRFKDIMEFNGYNAPSSETAAEANKDNDPFAIGAPVPVVRLGNTPLHRAIESKNPERFIDTGWKISKEETDKNGNTVFTLEKPVYHTDENGQTYEGVPKVIENVPMTEILAWRADAETLLQHSEAAKDELNQERPEHEPASEEVAEELGEVAIKAETVEGGFVENDQYALLDTEGNMNPDLIETSGETKQNKSLDEYSADELRAALARAEARQKTEKKAEKEHSYEVGQEIAIRRHVYINGVRDDSKLGALEYGWKIEAINDDGTYLVGKEHGKLHDGREGHIIRDGVTAEELTNWQKDYEEQLEDEAYAENKRRGQEIDWSHYDALFTSSTNRVSDILRKAADKYEQKGGLRGMAKRIIRRIGSAAYRKSGLKAGVDKVRNAKNRAVRGIDRATNAIGSAIEKPFDMIQDLRIAIGERRLAARERAKKRALENMKRAQERLEREAREYSESIKRKAEKQESGIDLAELVANDPNKARGRHRKANERKERRRAVRREALASIKEAGREYWNTSRIKKVGAATARFALKAKGATKGAVSGAISGARAGAQGHLSVRR